MARLGGLQRRRELGQTDAKPGAFLDMRARGVVVAGHDGPHLARQPHGGGLVRGAVTVADRGQLGDMGVELRVRDAVFPLLVFLQLRQIAELAIARRVVHQADKADAVIVAECGQFGLHRFGTDLGAQMDKMADPRLVRGGQRVDFLDQRQGVGLGIGAVPDRPHPQRVKDGGDADAGQFSVMGEDGGGVGPVHAGARLHVAFQIVGVQLDQTGRDVIPAAVDGPRGNRVAFGDPGDVVALKMQRAAHHPVGQDQVGIGKNRHEGTRPMAARKAAVA